MRVEIASGPVALYVREQSIEVYKGISDTSDCSEHEKDSRHLGGGETGGIGFREGAEELQHVAKPEFRHSAFYESDE